jgi:hypothetical protein
MGGQDNQETELAKQTHKLMENRGLPPLVAEIADGEVTWQRIEGLDYETLGYFLSCHLIIEHYMTEYLKIWHPSLDWKAARHTFGQKAAPLSKFKVSNKYDCIPPIKHLNSLRNKLSHDIEFKIGIEDLLPLTQYLSKAYENKAKVPTEPKAILEDFTTMSCVLFAALISEGAKLVKPMPK